MLCTLRASRERIMSSIIGREGSSSSGPSGWRLDVIGADLGIANSACLSRALEVVWNCMATRSAGALHEARRADGGKRGSRCGT